MTTRNRNGNSNRNSHRCAFCGSLFPQGRLMRPPGQNRGGICFDCIRELAAYVADRGGKPRSEENGRRAQKSSDRVELTEKALAESANPTRTLVPREIYASLDAYVIGQERAKKPSPSLSITTSSASAAKPVPLTLRSKSLISC